MQSGRVLHRGSWHRCDPPCTSSWRHAGKLGVAGGSVERGQAVPRAGTHAARSHMGQPRKGLQRTAAQLVGKGGNAARPPGSRLEHTAQRSWHETPTRRVSITLVGQLFAPESQHHEEGLRGHPGRPGPCAAGQASFCCGSFLRGWSVRAAGVNWAAHVFSDDNCVRGRAAAAVFAEFVAPPRALAFRSCPRGVAFGL